MLRRNGQGRPKQHRLRRFFRLRTVRAVGVLIVVFFVWVAFSVGQALSAPNGGSISSKLAEWARDHYLGPVVTLGEWVSYEPPKVGGKPSFSLAVPSGQAISSSAASARPARSAKARTSAFRPDIPAPLASLAGSPLSGEGQWRVLEKVHGEPALLGTFLRDATYTSYVNGIVSMDQQLVSFQLHPGNEDPGGAGWGPKSQPWIPPSLRAGLLATFNGGFKLDSAEGGFYLNGRTWGTLTPGAASIVYYRNGTIKIGVWDRTVRDDLVGRGRPAESQAYRRQRARPGLGQHRRRDELGGDARRRLLRLALGPRRHPRRTGHLRLRSGTRRAGPRGLAAAGRRGRGPAARHQPVLDVLRVLPAGGHPSNPTPVALLPTQQQTVYRYYSPYSRDFTAVYAR